MALVERGSVCPFCERELMVGDEVYTSDDRGFDQGDIVCCWRCVDKYFSKWKERYCDIVEDLTQLCDSPWDDPVSSDLNALRREQNLYASSIIYRRSHQD